ncbi:FkbM family methyltransferase [Ideonella sp.]|uniref:FkbM family methyltransferase n=1 Tax=Ideonella sp. TaxID=1929293 RepID=UPI0035AE10AC
MSALLDSTPSADPVHEVHALGVHYRMVLPQAASDYIQKKIADTHSPYEREMLEEMAGRLSPGDLVVDVGANVGNHTLFLAAVAGCRVIALEPHAGLSDAIEHSARLNGLSGRVRVHRQGAGASPSRATLAEDNPGNLGAQKLVLGEGDVEVVALDSLSVDGPVRALKIDVEGMELDVLRGAEALVARDRPLMYVECINDAAFRALLRWLEPRGYVCWETFNATPTHLFMPIERVSMDQRLARLQDKAFHESYRTAALLTSVRTRLTHAVEQERRARDELASARAAAATLAGRLSAVEQELHDARRRQTDTAAAWRAAQTRAGAEAAQAARLDERARSLVDEHARLQAHQDDLQARLDAAHAALRQAGQHRQALESELLAHAQRLEQAVAEAAEQARRARDAEAAQAAAQAAWRLAEQQRDAAEAELRVQAQRLDAAAAEATGQARRAGDAEAALAAAQAALQRAEAELRDHAQRLERASAEAAAQARRATEAEAARAAVQATLAQSESAHTATRAALALSAQEAQKLRERGARLVEEQRRLRGAALASQRALRELQEEHGRVLRSWRFRVGTVLAEARTPAGLMRLSGRLWRAWRRRASAPVVAAPAGPATARPAEQPATAPAQAQARAPAPGPVPAAAAPARAPVPGVAAAPPPRPVAPTTYRQLAPAHVHAWRVGGLCTPEGQALWAPECRWEGLDADTQTLPDVDTLLLDAAVLCALAPAQAARWAALLAQAAERGIARVLWTEHGPDAAPAARAWAERVDAVVCGDADGALLWHTLVPQTRVGVWPTAFQPRAMSPFADLPPALPAVAEIPVVDDQQQSTWSPLLWQAVVRRQLPVARFSRALQLLWGDLVVASDAPAQRERAVRHATEERAMRRQREAEAIVHAWSEHRAERRLASLRQWLWPSAAVDTSPRVAVVVPAPDAQALQQAARLVLAQGVPACLVALGPDGLPSSAAGGLPWRRVGSPAELPTAWAGLGITHVTVLDPARPWPAGHLRRLWAAASWSAAAGGADGAAATDGADGADDRDWHCRDGQAAATDALVPRAVAEAAFAGAALPVSSWQVQARLAWVPAVVPSPAIAAAQPVAALEQALATAVASAGCEPPAPPDVAPPVSLSVQQWAALLPAQPPAGVQWTLGPEGLQFEADILDDRVEYAYLDRHFDVASLKAGQPSLMHVAGRLKGDVRAVLVFHDAKGRKISHLMHPVGTEGTMAVPAGTAFARLALRFQRQASGCLGPLELARPKLPPRLVVPTSSVLLIAKQYPSYDDLYRFGFVHSRVRGYRERGQRVDVFRLGGDARGRFREFEDIGVQDGEAVRLRAALSASSCRTVLVHYMDRHVWSVLREHLDHVRVVIWVHGAEIQPWWRRAINHATDTERDKARRGSDERLAMWREVLGTDSPNLRLVFVSAKQAGEAFADLGVFPEPARYRVISNFIDGSVFPYRPKTAEHRRRILSIRPYASLVYANDLMVRAIELLSTHPVFPSLSFTVIGDGPLFDSTVEPLRRFPNVALQQGFLTQHEIAEVHREHGIFLVPSRMDSQGVSRDEAMSSGLVPVTTRVAAIPEFVDDSCACLAEPEDAQGLADAILALQDDPERFLRLSEAAAARVRERSGAEQTVGRELALLRQQESDPRSDRVVAPPAAPIAVYGDLNLNIMDGSAIWAASLAETLSGLPGVGVTLLFKARIHRTQVVARLLDRTPQVRFVEPPFTDRNQGLDVHGAVRTLCELDERQHFHGFVLRGFDLCTAAAVEPRLRGRLWAYLTDIPQSAEQITPEIQARIATIIGACRFLLCQTPQFEAHMLAHWPEARGKTVLLPPMIPPPGQAGALPRADAEFRLCYAGKFAPRWGIRDLFSAFARLSQAVPSARLHVYGDKIHHVPDEPGFREEIRQLLETTPGVVWHGAVDRDALMRAVASMDACWAFRDPVFEAGTHELSTKVLEYASTGVPVVLARSPVNESLLGADYPLFARDAMHAAELLGRLAADPGFAAEVGARLRSVADDHAFEAVGRRLLAQGVLA